MMELPRLRFPGCYHEGPSTREASVVASALGWGEHGGVVETAGDPENFRHFVPLYSRTGEKWVPAESVPSPLLPPNVDCGFAPVCESDLVYKKTKFSRHTRPDRAGVTIAFSKQLGHFYWDHNSIAFQSLGRLLEPHCHLGDALLTGKIREHTQRMTNLLQSLKTVSYQDCSFAHTNYLTRSFSYLSRDWLQDVPPEMLAPLVNEGMTEAWRSLQFQASLTGGALSWTPYRDTSYGCLIYPRGAAMNQLHFQQINLDQSDGRRARLQGDPAVYDLKEPIQQVSTGRPHQVFVGVRSSYHLASWSFSDLDPPRALSVLSTRTPSTCINTSPHLAGEFCVCTESGTLYLWSVETGLQRVRQDTDTLCFRDDPLWRWSDFTCHPRVLTLADRTGVQLVDVRVPNSQGRELYRIGKESSCQKGERIILSHCMRETNPAHCLVNTQFSLYIMDERFPLVPLVKWDHTLERPPAFVSVVPGDPSKILLGTQHSQETLMVQYSGGESGACQLHLPAISLPRISESLDPLPPLLPHVRETVLCRLRSPLAGIVAASPDKTKGRLLVFQLTAAGDLFVQSLWHEASEPAGGSSGVGVQRPDCNSTPEEPSAAQPYEDVIHGPGSMDPDSCLFLTGCNSSFHRWLHDLYAACPWRVMAARPRCGINKLFLSEKMSENAEVEAGQREILRQSMKGRTLVPAAAAPTPHTLEAIRPERWKDPLSQRLTASWEGRLGLWWDDKLGKNRQSKIQALREKRRRQKLLRSHSRSSLSGGFTASVTSDLYDADPTSPWSGDGLSDTSAPVDLPPWPPSQDCASGAKVAPSSAAIVSSQSLRAKGIPHERRQTLRNFLSSLEVHPTSQTLEESPSPSLTESQTQSLSQRSQPASKRFRMGF